MVRYAQILFLNKENKEGDDMMGKTHKAIGIAAGAAFAIHGLRQGDAALMLALVSAPIAAMLPDIDHSGSGIGKIRKKVVIANTVVITVALILIAVTWLHGQFITRDIASFFVLGLVVIIPTIALFYVSQIKWVRKTLKFMTKHRGIMHTLLIPAFCLLGVGFISDRYFLIMLYGFVIGYLSHIVADCFTVNGCPILFPFTRKNIRFAKVTTKNQGKAETFVATIMILVILAMPFLPIF